MDFENQNYRDNLAEELKQTPDREMRQEVLEAEKQTDEYSAAHFDRVRDRSAEQDKEIMEGIVDSAETIEGLLDRLGESNVMVPNEHAGFDHQEHTVKRIEMAIALNCLEFLPKGINGLREKVRALGEQSGADFKDHYKHEEYVDLLKEKFSSLNLSNDEWTRVTNRLPPDVYTSVDVDIEKIVILLNSFEDVKTRYSCAGHQDGIGHDVDSAVEDLSGYLAMDTEDSEVIELFMSLSDNNDNTIEPSPEGVVNFRFDTGVPQEWIDKNGKRNPGQIFDDSKASLEKMLGGAIVSDVDDQGFFEEILELQKKYLAADPSRANEEIAFNKRLIKSIEELLPSVQRYNEYEGYLQSDEADQKKLEYLGHVEDEIGKMRARKKIRSLGMERPNAL